MARLNNSSKKDGNSTGLFGKWKKGHSDKKAKNVSFAQTSPPKTNYEKKPSTKSCLNIKKYNEIDSDSDIDLVPYSKKGTARPATKSKASSQKTKVHRNEKTIGTKIYSNDTAQTTGKTNRKRDGNVAKNKKTPTSMMTPDMMETLGLVELHQEDQFRRETRKHGNASNSTVIRSPATEQTSRNKTYYDNNAINTAVIRSPATAALAQPGRSGRRTGAPRKVRTSHGKSYAESTDNESSLYFADSDSVTKTSDSATSYSSNFSSETDDEPIPRDPCPNMDYCYFADDGDDDDDDVENTKSMSIYQNLGGKSCGPMACASMVLAMPVACGLLCVDNILNTTFFDAATESYRKTPTNTSPEIMGKNTKGSAGKKAKSKQRNHRGNKAPDSDDDDEDDDWNAVCDLETFLFDNDKNATP